MNDGSNNSNKKSLKAEWSLLIEGFLEKESENNQIKKLNTLSKNIKSSKTDSQIQNEFLELSHLRKTLLLQVEQTRAEVDRLLSVVDNLNLVGSDSNELMIKIENLEKSGILLVQEINQITEKIKFLRQSVSL